MQGHVGFLSGRLARFARSVRPEAPPRNNLNAIVIGLGLENIEYEPEQFPGLIYRLEEPRVVVLLFGSGRLVITGGRQNDDAELACSIISERLDELGLFD